MNYRQKPFGLSPRQYNTSRIFSRPAACLKQIWPNPSNIIVSFPAPETYCRWQHPRLYRCQHQYVLINLYSRRASADSTTPQHLASAKKLVHSSTGGSEIPSSLLCRLGCIRHEGFQGTPLQPEDQGLVCYETSKKEPTYPLMLSSFCSARSASTPYLSFSGFWGVCTLLVVAEGIVGVKQTDVSSSHQTRCRRTSENGVHHLLCRLL